MGVSGNEQQWINRIASDPTIHHGEPCVRGTRIPVSVVVGSIADGDSADQVVDAYPALQKGDIRACLKYAALAVRDVRLLPLTG